MTKKYLLLYLIICVIVTPSCNNQKQITANRIIGKWQVAKSFSYQHAITMNDTLKNETLTGAYFNFGSNGLVTVSNFKVGKDTSLSFRIKDDSTIIMNRAEYHINELTDHTLDISSTTMNPNSSIEFEKSIFVFQK